MLDKATYWQIGSGQGERDYSRECLDYGLAFVGAGDSGREMEKVNEGDVLVLRRGVSCIVAVGRAIKHGKEVTGLANEEKMSWLKDFDGWDLPAYCHVEWHKPDEPKQTRTRLPRSPISRLHNIEVRKQVEQVLAENPPCESNRDGPSLTQEVTLEEMEDFLGESLGGAGVQEAMSTIRDTAIGREILWVRLPPLGRIQGA